MGIPEVGQVALFVALGLAVYALAAPVLGERQRLAELIESSQRALIGIAALTSLAVLALLYAFLNHDFALRYVAETSNRAQPLWVTLSGLWGGQAGSLLFWSWMLALFSALAVWRSRKSTPALAPIMGATLAAIQLFFLVLLAFVSSPFERLPLPPPDGRGLNPLLWHVGMRLHPPMLLAGYMSFSIPFALAIAALVTGRLGRGWLSAARPWIILAWAIQSGGLLLGAWWAYYVLGWGGYWGWDPVENVALLPWLTATALLHSLTVQERRGLLPVWNMGLVIATFALAIFGTFIVRSGILASVHSFALSAIGPAFFAFLGLTLIVSLGLLLYRLPQLRSQSEFDAVTSRESGFVLNNLLLVSISAATFWGTIFPFVSEAARGVKVAVGAPFYQQVNGPLLLLLLVLMGIGPLLAWRRTSLRRLGRYLRWPAIAWGATSSLFLILSAPHALAALAFGACAFVAATIAVEYSRGVRLRMKNAREGLLQALTTLVARDRHRYGGYLVHVGVVFIAMGVIGSSFFQQEEAATLVQGESLTIGAYQVTYQGLYERTMSDVETVFAQLTVQRDGRTLGNLQPERRIHRGWEQQPITGVAAQTYWPQGDDLYVLLTGWDEVGAATLRVFINPLVSLLWIGGLIFFSGTLVAAWPARRRTQRAPVRAPTEAPAHVA